MKNIRYFRGKIPQIGEDSYIDPSDIIIGDVLIGRGCTVWPGVIIRADEDTVTIGDFTAVMDRAFVEAPRGSPVNIGENCLIGHGAILHGCEVEDDVLIGIGAIVLDKSTIGEGSIVGAGAVVSPGKKVSPGSLVAGNPAKVKRKVTRREQKELRKMLKSVREKAKMYAEDVESEEEYYIW